ncbi:MAG: TetR/AcrR family transcriptional regulator, partial [Bacillota bacterium]|nr:TetR/AcrR family transcriptional regulator [Bacillota bacterium]
MRTKIINATMDIIVKSGFKKLTVDDIAKKLGISKKTIYKHFSNKEEIISEVVNTNLTIDKENTLKAIESESTWIGKFRAAVLFHHMNRIPVNLIQEIKYLFPNEWANINNLREFKTNLIHELIDEGIKENYIKQDVSTDIIILILSNTLPAIFDYDILS